MGRLKNDLRCCKYCSHKKMDLDNVCYYCANRQSEHYLEKIKDDTIMHFCKGGNSKKQRKKSRARSLDG